MYFLIWNLRLFTINNTSDEEHNRLFLITYLSKMIFKKNILYFVNICSKHA